MGESNIASMDEALLSPAIKKLLKNIWPKEAGDLVNARVRISWG